MVILDPKTHIYTDENNIRYWSVTQILSTYKPPFDPEGRMAAAVAKREKTTVAAIKQKWRDAGDKANAHGTSVHKSLEDYILEGTINEEHSTIIGSFIKLGIDNVKSEQIVWHQGFKLAGTVDLIEQSKNKINIFDFKTNKEIRFFSQYNARFLGPLEHLELCEYNNYCLQLSIYAWMLESKGENIGRLGILWVDPATLIMKLIPVPYMKETVINLLKNFNYKQQ